MAAVAARRRSCEHVPTPLLGAETAVLFSAVAFFGAMLDDELDVDAGSCTSLNSGAPYLARQMSGVETQTPKDRTS